ncbi:hypothetical protein [Lignipirellula cremea]|uniref:Uncharacterized protein n=1 Tax=Lignipirellula cremea TaxID=2528010 RepID=A0A518E1U1_9BACT|nr:hypothetical protein [Lignipirellula cremea]QDU98044.1 hypothetical protein Pla8534_59050 [Lignipirellula cremea]
MRLVLLCSAVLASTFFAAAAAAQRPGKPAPPPSRYSYTLSIDAKSLPPGVTVRKVSDDLGVRHFVKNSSDKPLVLAMIYSNDRLVSGKKLLGGKVYGWFPSGVPMAGKQHLKGWQAPFGDIEETLLTLPRDPERIYAGREKGLDKTLPADEPVTIEAEYDGQPYAIKGTIHYQLNPAYDAQR